MRKLCEIIKVLKVQKRIVSEETICGNTVIVKKMSFSNPHISWLFRFLNSVIVLIEVIYEIIIHLILKSSFLSTKSAQQTLSTNPKKRYLNSNNSQCSVTSKQNIYIKKKRYSMYTILNAHNITPLHTQTHRQRLLVFNMHQNCNVVCV